MGEIQAIIFDMDGVLLDSETICDKAWQKVGQEIHLEKMDEALKACLGCNKTDSIANLKKIYGEDFDGALFLQRTSYYFHKIEEESGIPLMPYVKETLDYLSSKYILALASSTRSESVHRQLKAAGIHDYFKTFTCGDMVTHSKPNPEIYLMACKSINVAPENAVAIEDSPNGIKSAVGAGIKTIMVPDKIQPTQELKKILYNCCTSLQELKKLL